MMNLLLLLAPILLLAIVALLGFVGCSFHSGAATVTVDPPSNPTAIAGDSWVQVSWDPYMGATDYIVNRGTAAGVYTSLPDPKSTSTSYLDTTATDGTTYHYAVQVTTSDGTSGYSADVAATPGAITYVQRAEIDVQGNGTTVTSNAFPNALTAGNLLVVWVWYKAAGASNVAQIADSVGNQYLGPIAGPTAGAGALAGYAQEIWYAKNIVGGLGVKVTATLTGNTTERAISAHEYAGADPNNPFADVAAMAGNGANATVGPVTIKNAKMIFAGAIFPLQGNPGTGFTQRSALQGNVTEDQPVKMPGSFSATFTNTAQDWVAQMVTFR